MAPYSVLQNRNCGILLQLYKLDTGYILNKTKKNIKNSQSSPPPLHPKNTPPALKSSRLVRVNSFYCF
jgi:hypothetical protein